VNGAGDRRLSSFRQRVGALVLASIASLSGLTAFGFASVSAATSPVLPITVAAASDLKFALDDVVAQFQAQGGAPVRVSYGSSGNFYRQIMQDAPFDVFMSADESLVSQLAAHQKTADAGALYGIGRIVMFVPKNSPIKADATFADLRRAMSDGRLKKIAIANPEHAPYGRAAKEALLSAGLWAAIEPRLVLGENVSQAAQFAVSGATQAAIFAQSLAVAPVFANHGTYALIPQAMHAPLRQRMVLLRKASPEARALYAYLQQPAARAIFQRYGFALPDQAATPAPR
jgi:molybdate transport system substrate-binding protein